MIEQLRQKEGNEAIPERNDEVIFSRHSISGYQTYKQIRLSDNPRRGMDVENQITPDLTDEGVKLAEKEATVLFDTLNPQTDELFFASSNEARALETAAIYKRIGKERGFSVIVPENTRGEFAAKIGDGEIRVLNDLSLNQKDIFISTIFNPGPPEAEPEDIFNDEELAKWNEARAMIEADDHGTWGANFFHHSEAVSKLFPVIRTAEEMYTREFLNLIRLARFGIEKAAAQQSPKNVKILAFGHENYMAHGLDKYFGEHKIKNCERIKIKQSNGSLIMEKDGVAQVLEA